MKRKRYILAGTLLGPAIAASAFASPSARSMISDAIRQPHQQMERRQTTSTAPSLILETPSVESGNLLGSSVLSWPGEILSQDDVDVFPSREGHITNWLVAIGEEVRRGQPLARLSPQNATLELASSLAENAAAVSRAKTKAEANERYVSDAKTRLESLRNSLIVSRDAAVETAERDAERDRASSVGAKNELDAERIARDAAIKAAQTDLNEARAIIPLKRSSARVSIERLMQRYGGKLSLNGTGPVTQAEALSMEFRHSVGILSSASRDAYRRALASLILALRDPQTLPEDAAQSYAQAAIALLAHSIPGDDLSAAELNDLRTDLTDDQKDLYDALKDARESQRSASVKESNFTKLVAERDRDLTVADTQAVTSRITALGAESYKRKTTAEAEVEFAQARTDLEAKISDLERELSLTHGEVRAAETAYATIAQGVVGQEILAPASGTVSSIAKRNGDHVTPEESVASIGTKNGDAKFVRFRIPSNQPKPETGDPVIVESPGYSLKKVTAHLVGIGVSLDAAGSYMAEAMFMENVPWPVHGAVRVSPARKTGKMSVPLSSIWWNEQGEPHVWASVSSTAFQARRILVGRVLGERVEILGGLATSTSFLAKADDRKKSDALFEQTTETDAVIGIMDNADATDQTEPEPHPMRRGVSKDLHGSGHED